MIGGEVDIVVVEDDPGDAELILRVLREHGWAGNCVLLKDGAEALDFFFAPGAHPRPPDEVRPKVIVMNLKDPKGDGPEVLRRLKSDATTKSIPVVVLTSPREERNPREAYRLGANSVVSKERDFEEFAKIVAELGAYWLTLNRTFRQ